MLASRKWLHDAAAVCLWKEDPYKKELRLAVSPSMVYRLSDIYNAGAFQERAEGHKT